MSSQYTFTIHPPHVIVEAVAIARRELFVTGQLHVDTFMRLRDLGIDPETITTKEESTTNE